MAVLPHLICTTHRIASVLLMIALTMTTSFASATVVHGSDTLLGNTYDTWQEPSDTTWRFACQTPTVPELRPVDIFFELDSRFRGSDGI